jgi:hypothetical protein
MNGRSYPVVLHDAEVMVQSLLKSSLMVEENMLFPDMDNPLPPPPPMVETIADVGTGQVFRSAHGHLCTGPNDILCSLIMYLDCICIDQHGCCSLEPGYATRGIWNVATRNKAEAWRSLGYIPNLYLLSKNENKFRMNSLEKLRMYHEILDAMLAVTDIVNIWTTTLMYQGGQVFPSANREKRSNLRGFVAGIAMNMATIRVIVSKRRRCMEPKCQKLKKMRMKMGLQVLNLAKMGLQVLDPAQGYNGQVRPRVVLHGDDNHECSNSAFFI